METLRHLERRLGELQERLRARAAAGGATPEPEPPEPAAAADDVTTHLDRLRTLRDEARTTLEEFEAEGRAVALDAGPFSGWSALLAYREQLAARPWVTRVELRGLAGRRALFGLTGTAPPGLAADLGAREDPETHVLTVDL